MKKRRLLMMMLGLCLGAVFGSAALELFLRLRTCYFNYRAQVAQTKNPTGNVMAGEIVRFVSDRRLVYGLRPDLNVIFCGVPLRTNHEGFRDTDHPLEKPPGKRRILFLGDSCLFGWRMPIENSYTSVLAGKLPDWDVMNMGVPGWNAAQEIECLRTFGLKYKPDVVVINFIGNDNQLPNYIQRSPTDMSASFLMDWLHGKLHRETLLPPQLQPGWKEGVVYLDDDPNRVPDQYRDLVGWEAVRSAYRDMANLGKQNGFKTVVLGFPGGEGHAKDYAAQAPMLYWDFNEVTARLMKERNIKEFMGSELAVTPTDAHPGAVMHQACAEFLAEHLSQAFPELFAHQVPADKSSKQPLRR